MGRMKFNHPHLDAAENITFITKLEHVKSKVYEHRYPQFKARQFIPVSHEADPGDQAIVYYEYDGAGMAKLLSTYSERLPRSDAKANRVSSPIKGVGSSYGYGLDEIRASLKSNAQLEQRRANYAARAVEQVIEDVGATGSTELNLKGLLTITNALVYTVPNGASPAQTTWAGGKTPDEILKDMHGIARYVVTQTNSVEEPDTMILPVNQYAYVAATRLGANIETTILAHFLKTDPYIKQVASWIRCAFAGTGGTTDRMVVYRRDPDYLSLEIPQEFEQLAPQMDGLQTVVPCHARTGGVICPLPLSVCYGDGI